MTRKEIEFYSLSIALWTSLETTIVWNFYLIIQMKSEIFWFHL